MQDPQAFEQLMQMMMAQGMRQWCGGGKGRQKLQKFCLFMFMWIKNDE